MAHFRFYGITKTGESIQDEMDAENVETLHTLLHQDSIRPTFILQEEEGKEALAVSNIHIPLTVLCGFTRQLYILISSGIPLIQTLEMLTEQNSQKDFVTVIRDIQDRVSKGSHFWETLLMYPYIFPKIYTALVRAGEASGALDTILKRLTNYLEDSDRLRKTVKSALMYPMVILTAASGVIALMLGFVIPQFETMLKNAGQELPAPTQFVLSLSHFVVQNYIWLIGGLIAFVFSMKWFLSTKDGKNLLDQVIFKMPLFGKLAQIASIARFARTLQILLTAGMNLLDALDICLNTIDNYVIEKSLALVRKEIETGKSMSSVLMQIDIFPKLSAQMIGVGEATGHLSDMLEKIADTFDMEVELMVGGLSKLIEPILIVFIGGIVGGMLISMYLPIFNLASGV